MPGALSTALSLKIQLVLKVRQLIRAINRALASSSMGPRSEERGNVQTLSRTLYYFLSSMRPRRVTRMSYHGDSPSSIKNWLTKGSPNRIPLACIPRMVGPTLSISFCSFAIWRTPKLPMKSIPSARAFRRAGTSSKSATPPERKTDAITSNRGNGPRYTNSLK